MNPYDQPDKYDLIAFWRGVFYESFRVTGKVEEATKDANTAMANLKTVMNHVADFNSNQGELF